MKHAINFTTCALLIKTACKKISLPDGIYDHLSLVELYYAFCNRLFTQQRRESFRTEFSANVCLGKPYFAF